MTTFGRLDTTRKRKLITTLGFSLVVLASLIVSTSLVAAQNSDFSLSANPTTLCVNPGINGASSVTLASNGGFSGTVNLGASISPNGPNSPSLSSIPSSVNLSSGQTVPLTIGASTTQATPTYTYTITVAGLSGSTYRSVSISLVVSTDCSVGGVTVSTAVAPSGWSVGLGVAVVGLVGLVTTGLAFYARRSRSKEHPAAD